MHVGAFARGRFINILTTPLMFPLRDMSSVRSLIPDSFA
jgi:hypothetical protein